VLSGVVVLLPSVVVVVLVPVVALAPVRLLHAWIGGAGGRGWRCYRYSRPDRWSDLWSCWKLVSAEALGLGCCTPGSVAPVVAIGAVLVAKLLLQRCDFRATSASGAGCARRQIRLAPIPNASAVLFIWLSTVTRQPGSTATCGGSTWR
jgi:hypothetical protein